jgi:hypothetical protein
MDLHRRKNLINFYHKDGGSTFLRNVRGRYPPTRLHHINPKDHNMNLHHRENLKTCTLKYIPPKQWRPSMKLHHVITHDLKK